MILWVLSVLLLVVRIPISLLATFSLWMSTVWKRQDGQSCRERLIDPVETHSRGEVPPGPLGPLGVDEAVIKQLNKF